MTSLIIKLINKKRYLRPI